MSLRAALTTALLLTVTAATPAAGAAELPAASTALLSGAPSLLDALPTPVGPSSITSSAVSATGQYVAFTSSSDGLSSADDDSVRNVYVKDRSTGILTLVSRANGPDGEPAHADCSEASISDDGNRVAFTCAGPLDPVADTNNATDVYVRDLNLKRTTLVSRAGQLGPVGDGVSSAPAINANGEYVAFESEARNLDPDAKFFRGSVYRRRIGHSDPTIVVSRGSGMTSVVVTGEQPSISDDGHVIAFVTESASLDDKDEQHYDVYVRDVVAQTTVLASRADGSAGTVADDNSGAPSIDGDGKSVVFESRATVFDHALDPSHDSDIYRRSLTDNTTILVSVTFEGEKGIESHAPSTDTHGESVAFVTRAAFDPADTGTSSDTYVKNVNTYAMTVATRQAGADGAVANDDATATAISGDGKRVASRLAHGGISSHTDRRQPSVVVRDFEFPYPTSSVVRPQGDEDFVNQGGYGRGASLSSDGRFAAFTTNAGALLPDAALSGIAVRDRVTGAVTFVSRQDGPAGAPFADAYDPSISADGRRVAFTVDEDGRQQVWVRDLDQERTFLASRGDTEGGVTGDGDSRSPALSGDGNVVAFVSEAANLDDGDTDATPDVHVRVLDLERTLLVSRASGANGVKGDNGSFAPDADADGHRVAFVSTATNLGDGDKDPSADVHLRDLDTGATVLVSGVPGGAKANGPTGFATSIDAAGNRVAFDSSATNLTDTTALGFKVYVRDLAAGTIVLAGRGDGADGRVADSADGVISPDGRYVAFNSGEVLADGASGEQEAFRRDLERDRTVLVSRRSGADGAAAARFTEVGDISAGGGCVAFTTDAPLVASRGDLEQVYLRALRADCGPLDPPDEDGGAPGSDDGQGPGGDGVAPTGSPDTTAPVLTQVKLSRRRFRTGRARRRGTVLSFRSSEAGTVTITFARVTKNGRRRAGTLTRRIGAGRVRVRITGLVGRRRLKAGRHRLTLVARDKAGNASRPVRRSFGVIA
jgi:Tol biopolymer transport system component